MQEIINFILLNPLILKIVQALVILLLAIVINLLIKIYFRRLALFLIKGRNSQDRRVIGTRLKISRIIASGIIYGIALITILLSIPGFRALSLSLLAGAGILAVIIGFAAQKTLSNIISGISIAVYAPFRIGDRINISTENGIVEDINLRHTIIKTWDNKRIIIPNAIISEKELINYSLKDEKMLFTLDLGISYDSDIDRAREIMVRLAKKHPENLKFKEVDEESHLLVKKEPYVRLISLGDFSLNLRLYFWVKDNSKGFRMRHELLEQIKKEFDKSGIEIPFPYRTIVYKKDLKKKKK